MQTFELEAFLNHTLAEYKEYASRQNIELNTVTDLASFVMLRGDTAKIKYLLGCLLQSTIDHASATIIRFTTRQLLKSDREILLEFALEDNGSVAKSSKRFSYYRALVTAKTLIEELNGKSELILSPDRGTTLRFIIRCALKGNTEKELLSNKDSLAFLRNKKVLVVDDNEINQQTITQFLKTRGLDFDVASSGMEAIGLLEQKRRYDLILLDLQMPGMDGFETANYIRKRLQNTLPIIAMAINDHSETGLMCEEAGIDSFIKKPFTAAGLLGSIAGILSPILDTDLAEITLKIA